MHMNSSVRLFSVAMLMFWCSIGSVLRSAEPPNVLFIAVDDLNHWVTHLNRNQQAQTPNIDRLAAKGTTFTRAYCAVPACNPSRAALMSGLRPWTSACYTNGDPWRSFIPEGIGLTAQFKKAGYHVAGAGKIYHNQEHYPSEWTQYMPTDGYHLDGGDSVDKMEGFHLPVMHDLGDEDLGDWHIVDWCIEQLAVEREQPLFLACGLYKPHLPFAVPRKYYEMFPLESIELPPYLENDLDDIPEAGVRMAGPAGDHARFLQSGRWKDAIQAYLATCAYTDMNIGRLLDALESSPIADNTIVVLWGDHGWSFGEKRNWRKFALWEEPTRAPFIWVAPGVTTPGGRCDQPVDFMTLYPTLCELARLPVPEHVEGESIAALLRDPDATAEHYAVTTHGYRNHAVRTATHRLIQYADGSEELYDHTRDPYEWENLALRPESSPVLERLRRLLPAVDAQRPRTR